MTLIEMRRCLAFVMLTAIAVLTFPAAALARHAPDYCEDVSFTAEQSAPKAGKVNVQELTITRDCRVVVSKVVELTIDEAAALAAGPTAGLERGILDTAGAIGQSSGVGISASTSYRKHSATQIWDCCGILLTEHWVESTWTSSGSTGSITAWGATHGARWHREGGGVTGWSLDGSSSFLGLVAGGLNQTFEQVKGTQGFSYIGAFDPSGQLFYNRLSDYVRGNRNGTFSCIHDIYLRRVPAGALAWKPPKIFCSSGFWPFR
jgi:hypothetical protein